MGKETEKLERRIKENIRNYTMEMLFGEKQMDNYLHSLADVLQLNILLTDRHGEEVVSCGRVNPELTGIEGGIAGRTLTVQGRTMGVVYLEKRNGAALTGEEEAFITNTITVLEQLATQTFLYRETAHYIDEKENSMDTRQALHRLEKVDGLTGVFHKQYYDERLHVIDRSETLPVALLFININDWKFVNDNYGDDESDRLIQIVAEILKKEAKEEYIIGRVDGDVFQVLIPLAEEGEAEQYKERVQRACYDFEDERLAPSAAIGIQYKTNVEETLTKMVSDAEYEMFQNKFDLKNEPGYAERLRKGLQ